MWKSQSERHKPDAVKRKLKCESREARATSKKTQTEKEKFPTEMR